MTSPAREVHCPTLGVARCEEYGGMPTVSAVLAALPDPVDHPVFCGLTAQEVPEAQRPPLEAYRAKYDGMPTYSVVLAALPDLTDHPVLRLRRRN